MNNARLFAAHGFLLAFGLVICSGCPDGDGSVDSGPEPMVDAGMEPDVEPSVVPDRPFCSGNFLAGDAQGVPNEPSLLEASGLVSSWTTPGLVWTHADSGAEPEIFALEADGQLSVKLNLGTNADDLEDIAVGLCPELNAACIYIFDTGDNGLSRSSVDIFVVTEERALQGGTLDDAELTTIPFSYESGPLDVEAAVVTTDGSTAYLFEKIDAANARVFSFDLHGGPGEVARRIATIETPGVNIPKGKMVTAADLHPTEERLVLRVYSGIFEYDLSGNIASDLEQVPALVAIPSEPQGEAIAYSFAGDSILSISEDPDQLEVQPILQYSCESD